MNLAPARRIRDVASTLVVAVALVAVVAACASAAATPAPSVAAVSPEPTETRGPAECPTSQPEPLPAGETRTVAFPTDLGLIEVNVEADLSPIAAGNFVALAECGYYDNVVFHRAVPGFVIQGGDGEFGRSPDITRELVGTGGPGYTITDEPVTTPYRRGVVAMARTPDPNSVGSQFFIVLDDAAAGSLSAANTYQIIGTVTEGMEVVDDIADDEAVDETPVHFVEFGSDVSVANP